MSILGYYHYFEDVEKFIDTIKTILINDFTIGKLIVLHDQILTKTGDTIGKNQKETYLLATIFDDKDELERFSKNEIIRNDNFIKSKDIKDDEFGRFRNLKKATTFSSYREFMQYVKDHNLK